MKIFIASNDGQVADRLGKCREFIIYTIENRRVMTREVVKNPARDAEQVCTFIILNNCDILIVGGLGQKSMRTLAMTNMRIGIGAKGEADNIIENLLNDENFDLETEANHYTCDCEDDCCCCGHHHHHESECCCGDDDECCCGDDDDCCCHEHEEHECCCHEHEEHDHECCCHHHE